MRHLHWPWIFTVQIWLFEHLFYYTINESRYLLELDLLMHYMVLQKNIHKNMYFLLNFVNIVLYSSYILVTALLVQRCYKNLCKFKGKLYKLKPK